MTDLSYATLPQLAEFEARYITQPLDNYLWFSGHLMHLARDLYAQFGSDALVRMWQMFVLGRIEDVPDEELAAQMIRADSALAALLAPWPQQFA